MVTGNADELDLKRSASEEGRKVFAEPAISGPVDILAATLFFQVTVGAPDIAVDVTDG